MAGFPDWLKKNTVNNYKVGGGLAFLGLDLVAITQSDSKLKDLVKTLARLALGPPLLAALAGGFRGMSKSIRSVIVDTGSLEAYLRKLGQIQGFQRIFAPLVGGAEAAKRKVAELVNLAAKSSFSFGDIAETARGLQVFTRGAYSSATALKTIGDAAAATGNGITQTGDAVGEFYSTLRAGAPITAASEKLRQMGLINGDTADTLVRLQQSGAGASQVFGELTSALGSHGEGMKSLKSDLVGVQDQHEKAANALKEKFASPFAESDVTNTRNVTDAMVALAPTVGSVAEWLAKLTNGFSTARSWMLKTAAETPVLRSGLELLIQVLTGVVTVASAFGAVKLGVWLMGLGRAALAASSAVTALNVAWRVAGVALYATGVGTLLAVLATGAGIIYNFKRAVDEQTKKEEAFRKANEDTTKAIDKKIAAIKNLSDRYEALATALDEVTKAQVALSEAQTKGDPKAIAEAKKLLEQRRQQVAQAEGQSTAPSEEGDEAARAEMRRARDQREKALDLEMQNATPDRRAALLRERMASDQAREQAARRGVMARAEFAETSAKAGELVRIAQGHLEELQAPHREELATVRRQRINRTTGLPETIEVPAPNNRAGVPFVPTSAVDMAAQIALAQGELSRANETAARVGLNAPEDSSVFWEAKARNSNDPREQAEFKRKADMRREEEGSVGTLAERQQEDAAALAALTRENDLTKERAGYEREIAELKSHGVERAEDEYRIRKEMINAEIDAENRKTDPDVARLDELKGQRASMERQLTERHRAEEVEKASIDRQIAESAARRLGTPAGDEEAVSLQNLDSYSNHYEHLRGLYGDDQAKAKAIALTNSEIQDRAGGPIASALARIGGGGGVDPNNDVQKQIRDYTQRIADSAERIDAAVSADDSASNSPDISRPE